MITHSSDMGRGVKSCESIQVSFDHAASPADQMRHLERRIHPDLALFLWSPTMDEHQDTSSDPACNFITGQDVAQMSILSDQQRHSQERAIHVQRG